MIPATYPSVVDENNRTLMVVSLLSDITGLTKWVDYIPVKPPADNTLLSVANTFANNGFLLVDILEDDTDKQAWEDYIPVYLDESATDTWSTDASGYIPMDVFTSFNVLSLFSNGEVGAWYDPSDMSTLYQNQAGTIPVTAVEQPVGLMLDKSKGLVLGSELASTITLLSINNSSGSIGTWNADTLTMGNIGLTAATRPRFNFTFDITTGKTYQLNISFSFTGAATIAANTTFGGVQITSGPSTVSLSAIINVSNNQLNIIPTIPTGDTIQISSLSVRELPGNHALQETSAARPKLSARYNLLLATATLATQNVTVTAGSHTLYFTGAGSITLSGATTGSYNAGTHTITTTAGTLTLTVSGSVLTADLRVVNGSVGLPVYQSVTTATNYNTVGFPVYLQYDGIDDELASLDNSIALTPDYTQLLGFYYNSGGTNSSYLSIAGIGTGTNVFVSQIRSSISSIAVATRGASLAIPLVAENGGTNSCLPNTNHVITATFTDGLQTIQSDNDAITSIVNTWTESNTIPNRWISGAVNFQPKRHFGVILINRELTVIEINNTKSYLNNKMSVTA